MGSQGSKAAAAAADHYTLLGLDDCKDTATPEQIRKAYHKSALKYHPDKLTSLILADESEAARRAKKEEIDFKKIVAAYEVLSDPDERRNYDSRRLYSEDSSSPDSSSCGSSSSTPRPDRSNTSTTRPDVNDGFDDDVPTDCAPGDFFKVFGPVFERNARYLASKKPVPGLGSEITPMEQVNKFYDLWYRFESNREFKHQYKSQREFARRQEGIRIRRLVDYAYAKDPRISRRKEEEKAEKEMKKKEKIMRKETEAKAAEEERQRREEEEKRAAEAAVEQKKAKERKRKVLKKVRSRFRTLLLASSSSGSLEKEDVERLCMRFDFEKLRKLVVLYIC